jgi:hypothetical protein
MSLAESILWIPPIDPYNRSDRLARAAAGSVPAGRQPGIPAPHDGRQADRIERVHIGVRDGEFGHEFEWDWRITLMTTRCIPYS